MELCIDCENYAFCENYGKSCEASNVLYFLVKKKGKITIEDIREYIEARE